MAGARRAKARAGRGDHHQPEPQEVPDASRQGVPDRRLFRVRARVDGLEGHADRDGDRPLRNLHRHAVRREDRVRSLCRASQPQGILRARHLQEPPCARWKPTCPVEEQYKNFKRGFESPISVGDEIHAGGDSNHGIQSVAFNLPNDERVREAKGAKKVILQNVLGAKYDRILHPMASLVLVPQDAANVNKRYMYMETLFHELSHSLGPGSITVNGQKTTVDKALKDVGGGFEEAKADVMGAYNVLFMMDKGVLPAAEKPQIRAAYVAGLFRAMRFGDTDAHGKGAAMQYRYIRATRAGSCGTPAPSVSASTRPSSTAESATSSPTSSASRRPAITTGPRRSSPNGR